MGRFLPRVVEHVVDARLPDFRAALERGGVPATAGWDPVVVAPMLPAPRMSLTNGSTGVYGTVRDAAGDPLRYAHLEWELASGGTYRTMTDGRGDYFVHLHEARSGLHPVSGERDPNITRNVRVHQMTVVPDAEDLLEILPTNFEDLRAGMVAFDAIWSPIATIPPMSIALVVGTLNRVDIG